MMDLIADEIRYYEIIAGGGSGDARKKTRTVYIKQGDFDYIRYYDMCEMIQEQEQEEEERTTTVSTQKQKLIKGTMER